jgi:hypothetical protein
MSKTYTIDIHDKAFWIATVQQMVLDAGHNSSLQVNTTTRSIAPALIQQSNRAMPLVFDLTGSRNWINLTDIWNFGGIHFISENGPDATRSNWYHQNYLMNAAAVAVSILSLGFFGHTANRFLKTQVSYLFFSKLFPEIKNWGSEFEAQHTKRRKMEKRLIKLVHYYLQTVTLEKNYYALQFCAAVADLIGSAILISGYLFAAPQLMILGGTVVLLGIIFGIYNYNFNRSDDDGYLPQEHYQVIFKYLKTSKLVELEQIRDGIELFPEQAIGEDAERSELDHGRPMSDLTVQVLEYFKDPA